MGLTNIRMILKACAEDTRLRILNLLFVQELTVKQLCEALDINQPVISKHLSRLRLLKIVLDRRQGNRVFYRLNSEPESFHYQLVTFLKSHLTPLPRLIIDKKKLGG